MNISNRLVKNAGNTKVVYIFNAEGRQFRVKSNSFDALQMQPGKINIVLKDANAIILSPGKSMWLHSVKVEFVIST